MAIALLGRFLPRLGAALRGGPLYVQRRTVLHKTKPKASLSGALGRRKQLKPRPRATFRSPQTVWLERPATRASLPRPSAP
jgi:hypothetical protein